ncbi:hypothetical protein EON64_11865, partial [archaeon]
MITDISDWIRKHGEAALKLMPDANSTFLDPNGLRRYKHNWQVAEHMNDENDFTDETLRYMVHHTGCRKVVIACEPPLGSTTPSKPDTHNAVFLNDWKRLWHYLEEDVEDELAEQAPLLRTFIEFFFHQKTCYLMLALYVYNAIVLITLEVLFPSAWVSNLEFLYDHVLLGMELSVYLALRWLYKGHIFEPPKSLGKAEDTQRDQDKGSAQNKAYIAYYSLHWTQSLRDFVSKSVHELHRMLRKSPPTGLQSPARRRQPRLSYYKLLNISLKFLTKYNGIDARRINFDRPSYRAMLLFIAFVLPIYILMYNYFGPYFFYVLPECRNSYGGSFCQFYIWSLVCTGLTKFCMQYLYASSVVLSLTGLAYGCETTHRLADSWLRKFASLRKVRGTTREKEEG